jgi:hypothetical protein
MFSETAEFAGTIVNVIGFPAPLTSVPEVARIVTDPTRPPVTVRVAIPAAAVFEPRPLTVPAPELAA